MSISSSVGASAQSGPQCAAWEQAAGNFLNRYAGASHPEFLVAAYQFFFQRGFDEAGYNGNLIKLYAGYDRAELAREFIRSEEFQKLSNKPGFVLTDFGPAPEATPLPPRSSLEQYQDIWVKGKMEQKGRRECADRFALISEFARNFQRPFTVLDLGANLGYFSLRLAETFDCTCVAIEGIYGEWIQEVLRRNENPRVVLLKKVFKLADLRALAQVEHFDVVLGLSVIHHLDGSFNESLEVLRSLGDHLILELPFEANACGQQLVHEAVSAPLPPEAVVMGFGVSHLAEGKRQIVRLSRPKTSIAKSYLGTPRTDLALTIHSDFVNKSVEFHNKPEARPWLQGINLQTYLWFNGAYPSKPEIAEALQRATAIVLRHRDIQSWNVVLQGAEVHLIDGDDPNHVFSYNDRQYLARLLLLLRAESMGSAALQALERVHRAAGLTLPVRWRGPIFNPSGYASEGINFVLPLSQRVELGIFHQNNNYSEKFVAGLKAEERDRLFVLRDKYPQISGGIVIEHNPANGFTCIPDAAYRIGRTMFETDRISPDWVTACNQMDEIWVPSAFNIETFASSGVERDKLRVMPESVDETEFDPAKHEPLPLPHRAGCNFLSIFEWSRRKGWDVLLAAYLREFSAEDDVCLYVRTYLFSKPNGNPRPVIERLIAEFAATLNLGDKRLPRIHILAEQVAQADLPRLYKAADCLVAPSRGEGWGRPHHEAMLMGLPVIATNWSGNTEFMRPENSFLIDYKIVDTASLDPELWHYRNHRWAEPSESSLRQAMRRVQQNPEEARGKGRRARQDMLRLYSRAAVADLMVARLQEIEHKILSPACPPAVAHTVAAPSMPAGQKPARLRVTWEGSFLDWGSLSHVNRELTGALGEGNRLQMTRVCPPRASVPLELSNLSRRIQANSPNQADVTVRHAWPPNWQRPATGAWVLIQPWEFGVLPADWVKKLSQVDEIWAPSEYVRRVYVESGIHPSKVKIVPNGVDPSRFHPGLTPLPLATHKKFKFLFVGGTIRRKGPDLLLKSYLEAFTAADDVCLVIKDFGGQSVYQGQTLEKEIAAARLNPNAPEIIYLTEDLPLHDVPRLYAACDCLVHPYRGEGFGLPVLEAMACGLPVVVTGGGATDDFATDEYAYRLPALRRQMSDQIGELKLVRKGWWLEPVSSALTERLRWIAAHPQEARIVGRAASDYAHREWTWQRAANIAHQHLQNLVARKKSEAAAFVARRARKVSAITLPAAARIGDLAGARELLSNKSFAGAWDAVTKAVAVRPYHPEGYLLLAEIAKAAGNAPVARQCAQHAKRLAPEWKFPKQFLKGLGNVPPPGGPDSSGRKCDPTLSQAMQSFVVDFNRPPRLSVCLIVKNEEMFLGRCLDSLRGLASQIVVVDTGSIDRTIDVAKEHGAEVYHFAWCDDFSAARNAALEHVTGDWVLSIDADEELLAEHMEILQREMRDSSVLAYRVPIIDKGREQEGVSYVPRLFRNAPGLFFLGRVHEQVFSSIQVRCTQWGLKNILGQSALFHHGYTEEMVSSRNKIQRNLRLLELAMEELPGEPNLVMNLGLEMIRAGQLEAGLEQYCEALRLMSVMPAAEVVPELRETLLTQLTTHLLSAGCFREIVELWGKPFPRSGGMTASQHFLLGLANMHLKQTAAAEQMRQCLATRGKPALSPVNKEILKAGPRHCLALCLAELQQKTEAEQAFREALAEDPKSRGVRSDFANFQFQQGNPVPALKLVNELVAENSRDLQAWLLGGQIALSQPEFLEFAQNWTREAVKSASDALPLLAHRAEALLLNQQVESALPFWSQAYSPDSPRSEAALILCEVLTGQCQRNLPPPAEKLVSQEFLKWYRRLIKFKAVSVVNQINEKLNDLQTILPSAVGVLGVAMKQAETTVAV